MDCKHIKYTDILTGKCAVGVFYICLSITTCLLSVYLGVAQHAQYYVSTNYVPPIHQQLHLITLFVCFTHILQTVPIIQEHVLVITWDLVCVLGL